MKKLNHREEFIYVDKNGKEIKSLIVKRITGLRVWHLYDEDTRIPEDEE